MNLWEYDFDEIYNVSKNLEVNFRIFAILVSNWVEYEFRYKGEDYFVVNWPSMYYPEDKEVYWFFWKAWENNTNKFCCKVCLFEEGDKLVDFLENFTIDWLTLREIFDTKIALYKKYDKDNCITRIA